MPLLTSSLDYPLIEAIQFVLWPLEKKPFDSHDRKDICGRLATVLDVSPTIPIRIVYANGTATLHPKVPVSWMKP